jgi:hypothetical protein
MTLTTFSAGINTSFSSQLNANFKNAYPRPVASTPYTGTGFDSAQGASGTNTANYTFTVASNEISDYIRIVITGLVEGTGPSINNYGQVSLKIETSVASAASWSTRFDKRLAGQNVNLAHSEYGTRTVEFYYAPTASEKSSGLDIRITTTSETSGTGVIAARFENVQTMIYAN